jgi:hypothetical protein
MPRSGGEFTDINGLDHIRTKRKMQNRRDQQVTVNAALDRVDFVLATHGHHSQFLDECRGAVDHRSMFGTDFEMTQAVAIMS